MEIKNKNVEVTPEVLSLLGFTHTNKAKMAGSEMMCWEKENLLLRYRANGLFIINPEKRFENISEEIKTVSDLEKYQ